MVTMKGILVRVGIDATAGGWNSPVDPRSREFVFVPIPEDKPVRAGFSRGYEELIPVLEKFHIRLPNHLLRQKMHLDPDFTHLTYGDRHPRNIPLRELKSGDFLVFYSGLRSILPENRKLVYAIIGFFLVDEVVPASAMPPEQWHENAHTRRESPGGDIVIRARQGTSGILSQCIPVGEYRDRAYRVRNDILYVWGGLTVKDGYLQRSGRLPSFKAPGRFLDWWRERNGTFEKRNF
jgi:hypothetical protein